MYVNTIRLGKWDQVAAKLFEIKQERKRLQELELTLQQRLIMMSNNQTSAGEQFVFLKSSRKGNVDYSLIPELMQVDLERYRKEDIDIWLLKPIYS